MSLRDELIEELKYIHPCSTTPNGLTLKLSGHSPEEWAEAWESIRHLTESDHTGGRRLKASVIT